MGSIRPEFAAVVRQLVLIAASLLLLTSCSGGRQLKSFVCEDVPNAKKSYSKTLKDRQKELDDAESLAKYHDELMPWVFDNKNGDLYQYDSFEEAFVPIRDYPHSRDASSYTKSWTEYSSKLSDDGSKLKIRLHHKSHHALYGERSEGEEIQVYDLHSKMRTFDKGGKNEQTERCMDVPVSGIAVKWRTAD